MTPLMRERDTPGVNSEKVRSCFVDFVDVEGNEERIFVKSQVFCIRDVNSVAKVFKHLQMGSFLCNCRKHFEISLLLWVHFT